MAKKLAHKDSKKILTEKEIKDQRLNVGEFTSNWNGRIIILNPEESVIAEQVGIDEAGEYAIKVR